jgi:hypothetical protein
MTPAKVAFVTILFTSAVAAGQPTPTPTPAPEPQPQPQADPTAPQPPPDGDAGMVAPLPVEPPVEPPPEEAKSDGPPAVDVTWDKGLTFKSADEKFEAKLALRTQLRYELVRSTEEDAETLSRFYLPRVRLQLEGHVFGKDNRYKVETGLGDRGSFAFVKDFFVERTAGGVWLRIGQWKRPFHRQELVSDFGSTFNERSITNEFAGAGRDVGFAIHNDYEKSPEGVEWVVGVFNGFSGGADRPRISTTCEQDPVSMEIECSNSAATTVPTDFSPAVVIRAGYNKGKVKGYTDMDLDGGPLRFGVALNYKVDLQDLAKGDEESVGDNLSHGIGVDAMVKVSGLDAQVSAIGMKLKSADLAFGVMAQLGYMVIPKKAHAAGRFAMHEIAGTDNWLLEGRASFSWLFAGHSLKIASDAGFLKETGGGDPEIQVRIMPQLTF